MGNCYTQYRRRRYRHPDLPRPISPHQSTLRRPEMRPSIPSLNTPSQAVSASHSELTPSSPIVPVVQHPDNTSGKFRTYTHEMQSADDEYLDHEECDPQQWTRSTPLISSYANSASLPELYSRTHRIEHVRGLSSSHDTRSTPLISSYADSPSRPQYKSKEEIDQSTIQNKSGQQIRSFQLQEQTHSTFECGPEGVEYTELQAEHGITITIPEGAVSNRKTFHAEIRSTQPQEQTHSTFECGPEGVEYTDLQAKHGITITIPEGAVSGRKTFHADVKLSMDAPSTFLNGKRPISAFLWLCYRTPSEQSAEYVPQIFAKPIEITMPHYLTAIAIEEYEKYGVGFAKAAHVTAPNCSYEFKDFPGEKVSFSTENGKAYGTLHTRHLCYLCIKAKYTEDFARKAGYCLSIVIQPNPSKLIFLTTFCIKTCIQTVNDVYCGKDGYSLLDSMLFTVPQYGEAVLHLQYHPDPDEERTVLVTPGGSNRLTSGWDFTNTPLSGKIEVEEVDFWTMQHQTLETSVTCKMYPPSLKLAFRGEGESSFKAKFAGSSKELSIGLFLPLERNVASMPPPAACPTSPRTPSSSCLGRLSEEPSEKDLMNVASRLNHTSLLPLGIELGLKRLDIRNIETRNSDSLYRYMDLFEAWHDKTSSRYTWETLVRALEKQVVGENAVAAELRDKLLSQGTLEW